MLAKYRDNVGQLAVEGWVDEGQADLILIFLKPASSPPSAVRRSDKAAKRGWPDVSGQYTKFNRTEREIRLRVRATSLGRTGGLQAGRYLASGFYSQLLQRPHRAGLVSQIKPNRHALVWTIILLLLVGGEKNLAPIG
jgi:hypothetical protein